MGRNYLADIPGNFFNVVMGTNASIASNGANARLADVSFVAPANLKVLSVWRLNQDLVEASISKVVATYRDLKILNGGTSGTGTVVIASVRSGTAIGPAAYGTQSFAITTDNTVTQGGVLWASALASVGAASDDTTAVSNSVWQLAYELL